MSKLPVLSGQEVIRVLRRIGYEPDHQRGSHIIMRHGEPPYRRVSIPNHREIARGTLRSIIREVGLTVEEFVSLV
ncbi:MAG TPA: type II toxin-antitoxin system HicA family toxin [Bacteroidota bacterium]|jgi:predicted RNA binding protein YcfA (HicA-like mRNA interferase family)